MIDHNRPALNIGAIGAPYFWWQHPTRMSIAIRLGITRMLLERRP